MPRASMMGPRVGLSSTQVSTTSAPARRCGNSEPGTAATANSSRSIKAVRMLVRWVQTNRREPRNPSDGSVVCAVLKSVTSPR